MQHGSVSGGVVASRDVRGYFLDSVERAMHSLRVRAGADTVNYVVNLLALYARSEELYELTPSGPDIRPLAFMYQDALEAPTRAQRQSALRRLGDVALFIGGFFAQSLVRKLVDVDYYIAMGGAAYSALSESLRTREPAQSHGVVFEELARKFPGFVDVLAEVSASAQPSSDTNILRLYEIWLRTGSARARSRLVGLGVVPAPQPRTCQ
jgi:hypothetical protein